MQVTVILKVYTNEVEETLQVDSKGFRGTFCHSLVLVVLCIVSKTDDTGPIKSLIF